MKTGRSALYAGAVTAMLVVALIVVLSLRDRNSPVANSPSPLAATSTPVRASSPPATPSPASTATAAPSIPPVAPGTRATAEEAADALAAALQTSDFVALESLITPSGFNWAKSGSGGLAPKTPQEAVQFLRSQSGGRLQVTVATRPIKASVVPWGTRAIESTWRGFGNVPQQSIDLVLHEVGGRWYWAGGFITS